MPNRSVNSKDRKTQKNVFMKTALDSFVVSVYCWREREGPLERFPRIAMKHIPFPLFTVSIAFAVLCLSVSPGCKSRGGSQPSNPFALDRQTAPPPATYSAQASYLGQTPGAVYSPQTPATPATPYNPTPTSTPATIPNNAPLPSGAVVPTTTRKKFRSTFMPTNSMS